jgi:tetratricopeptide (TPR) repeat protein
LYKLHRFTEALTNFDKAIELQPSSTKAWEGRSNAILGPPLQVTHAHVLRQYDEAIAASNNLFELEFAPKPAPWWALPMNSQAIRTELVRRLILQCKIARIIETGTYLGTTSAFFAQFGVPVTTAENNQEFAQRARARLSKWKNVELRNYDSVRVLEELSREPIDRNVPTLFYLDAHWEDRLPLRDEAELAVTHFAKAILLIDDFAIPDDPGYGFDDYGPGKQLSLEYLSKCNLPALATYFPPPSHQETGARRGCIVITANMEMAAILDQIPLLRRWNT